MRLGELVETSRRVRSTRSRLEKIGHLVACLRRAAPDEVALAVDYLSGRLPQGAIGVGPATLRHAQPDAAPAGPTLELRRVHEGFERIAGAAGAGAEAERRRLLAALLGAATRDERAFLSRLVRGELRQGALEGLMVEAVARAGDVPAAEVRRAVMLSGDLAAVASAVRAQGSSGLAGFRLEPLRPVRPMLAQSAEQVGHALGELGDAAFEFKLDGARIQLHKVEREIRVFTRRLNDVTDAVPELVETARSLPARVLVLDGEALALRRDGSPHPFQVTMRRFGRRLDVAALRRELPLGAFFFDCLHRDGEDLIERAAAERFTALEGALPGSLRVPRLVTGRREEAEAFLRHALERGHEGLMAKALDAPYEAGRRGGGWRKVKPSHTLDLVVLAAEWGSGRRRGWLSNLHLGARDPRRGGFVMLGKTFKGLTDAMLGWQTRRLEQLVLGREGHVVHVRPELVVEVAFDGVQESPQYPGGLALRFARVRRHRPDKRAAEADTIDAVRALHLGRRTAGTEAVGP